MTVARFPRPLSFPCGGKARRTACGERTSAARRRGELCVCLCVFCSVMVICDEEGRIVINMRYMCRNFSPIPAKQQIDNNR